MSVHGLNNPGTDLSAVFAGELEASSMKIDDLPCNIIIFDRGLNICVANQFARKMIQKATHLRHLELYEPGGTQRVQLHQLPVPKVFETGERFSARGFEFENPAGERVPLMLWAKPFETTPDGEVTKVLLMVHADYELDASGNVRRAKLEAEAAIRAKNHFLANVSHELRTPLTGIMGFLQLVIMGENMMPEQLKSLNSALDCTYRLQALMDSILEIASIEAEEVELVEEPYNLRELIADIDSAFSPQAELKGLNFDVKVLDHYHELIGDRDKVRQVIVALVDNAIKFTDAGRVELDIRTGAGRLSIQVVDTGTGIPRERQGELFEAFHQQLDYQSVAGQATGLGLTICKSYVQIMGGELSFESHVGQGSAFYVQLPVTTTAAAVQLPEVLIDAEIEDDFEQDEPVEESTEASTDALVESLGQVDETVLLMLTEAVLCADPSTFKQLLRTSELSTAHVQKLDYMMDTFRYDEILELLSELR